MYESTERTPPHSASPELARAGKVDRDTESWALHGIACGALGAFAIAVFFLAVDLLEGQALRTPAALGSALFRGQPLAGEADPPLILVVGYTAVHGAVFVGFGLLAAMGALGVPRLPRWTPAILTGVLFAAFEVVFLSFGALFMPGLMETLGVGRVAVANLIAAGAMTAYLLGRARPRGA